MIDTACSHCGSQEWDEKMSGMICRGCRYFRREVEAGMTICVHLVEPYSCGVCFPAAKQELLNKHL